MITELDELNREMAEFAGFTWHKKRQQDHLTWLNFFTRAGKQEEGHWDYKGECQYEGTDGKPTQYSESYQFRFALDLTTCFKWLVPQLWQRGWVIFIEPIFARAAPIAFRDTNFSRVGITNIYKTKEYWERAKWSEYHTGVSLALCLAVKQLKDKEPVPKYITPGVEKAILLKEYADDDAKIKAEFDAKAKELRDSEGT